MNLSIWLKSTFGEIGQNFLIAIQRYFDSKVMQRRNPWLGSVPLLPFPIGMPFIAKKPYDLRMSLYAVRYAHKGNGLLNHANKRKAQHISIKGD